MTQPYLHSTPADAVADRVREKVTLEGMTFHLERPAALDGVFDHPGVRNAYAADEYIPYWTDLWAAGRMLAKVVLREDWSQYPPGEDGERDVLEIGCGLGLGGIAALASRLRVTFSDVDATAVEFAILNAKLNGHMNARGLPLDVRATPPPSLQFPLIIGSDILYEQRMVDPVARFIKAVLTPTGTALITDPDRISSRSFRWVCGEVGLAVETQFVRAGEPGGERTKGTLYRLRHLPDRSAG